MLLKLWVDMYTRQYQNIVEQLMEISCDLHDENWHIYLFYSKKKYSIFPKCNVKQTSTVCLNS